MARNACVPIVHNSSKSQPWWNSQLTNQKRNLIRLCRIDDRYIRRHNAVPPADLHAAMKRVTKHYKKAIRYTQLEHYSNFVRNAEKSNNTRGAYEKVTNTAYKISTDYIKNQQGEIIADHEQVLTCHKNKICPPISIAQALNKQVLNSLILQYETINDREPIQCKTNQELWQATVKGEM